MRPDEVRIDDWPDEPVWGVREPSLDRWQALTPGSEVTILKWSPEASAELARYPGRVVATSLPAPWAVLEARWTYRAVRQANLIFEPGDILHEVFSPVHPFDAFAVYDPDGTLKGWYGNVTHPAFFSPDGEGDALVWHDLYIDLVATPDGAVTVLDEDELGTANLRSTDPELHARILAARDEMLARFHARRPPFSTPDRITVPPPG